jgi:hypothetical protein
MAADVTLDDRQSGEVTIYARVLVLAGSIASARSSSGWQPS